MVGGRLLQGIEQARGVLTLHQTGGQSAGHVLYRGLHRVQVVEGGQVEAVGQAPDDGTRHADTLAAQPQMAVAVAAIAQRRRLAVEAALHEVVAKAGGLGRFGFMVSGCGVRAGCVVRRGGWVN
jgi:hypothetical protein